MEHGDSIQAVLWAKKLIDLDPQDPDAHYALAARNWKWPTIRQAYPSI